MYIYGVWSVTQSCQKKMADPPLDGNTVKTSPRQIAPLSKHPRIGQNVPKNWSKRPHSKKMLVKKNYGGLGPTWPKFIRQLGPNS